MSTPSKHSRHLTTTSSHSHPYSDSHTFPQPSYNSTSPSQSRGSLVNRPRPRALERDISTATSNADTNSGGSLHPRGDPQRLRENSIDQLPFTTQDLPEGQQLLAGPPGIARRAKAHVPSACVNCKRKHLACETRRPCNRCIQTGKEATCVDVQHKKRGRPRLREEENAHEVDFGLENPHGEHYPGRNGIVSVSQAGRRRSKSYRELRSQPDNPYGDTSSRPSDPGFPLHPSLQSTARASALPTPSQLPQSTPTVFLTPEFLVAEHNHAFADALGLVCSAKGQSLTDLVVPSEKGKIQRLQTALRAELVDLSHMRRLHGNYENENGMPAIENLDLGHATAGFRPRSEYWTFRLPKGRSIGFPITLSLARNGGHFIILTFVQSSNVVMQPSPHSIQVVQSRQLASPSSSQGPRSPPRAVRTGQSDRDSFSRSTSVYPLELSPPQASESESRLPLAQPSQNASLDQYNHHSPLQTPALSYGTGRPPSSSESSRSSQILHHEMPGDNLRHLQLPPIRTSGKGISEPSRSSDEQRSGHSRDKLSPAKGSPQSGRKKKRQRVEIVDMLH